MPPPLEKLHYFNSNYDNVLVLFLGIIQTLLKILYFNFFFIYYYQFKSYRKQYGLLCNEHVEANTALAICIKVMTY